MQEWKAACKVDDLYCGIVHVVEQEYDSRFKVWYGSINISSTQDQWYALWNKNINLKLEDGRVGIAKVLKGHAEEVFVVHEDNIPGQNYILYFVGLYTLGSIP